MGVDPVSVAAMAVMAVASIGSAVMTATADTPSAPDTPALPADQVKEDTGAEVAIGTDTAERKLSRNKAGGTSSVSSLLGGGQRGSGLNI